MQFRKNNINLFSTTLSTAFTTLIAAASLDSAATEFIVTKTIDSFDGICDSDCSLREAIETANQNSGNHFIKLSSGTYELTIPSPSEADDDIDLDTSNSIGDLDIRNDITITGKKDGSTVINAGELSRHFTVYQNSSLTLKHLQLINGFTSFHGGSISNSGSVKIENCLLINNLAISYWHRNYGGAIANWGTLTIQRTEFINNTTAAGPGEYDYAFGGAIYNFKTMTIRDSAFRSNRATTDGPYGLGGAIYNHGITDVGRSVFIGNSTKDGGMAIYNAGTARLSNTTISKNRTESSGLAGALQNEETLTLINSSIVDNNPGAGLYSFSDTQIRNSIILNNNGDTPINCYNQYTFYPFKTRGLLLGGGNTQCEGDIYVADSETFTRVLAPLAQNNYHLESHALLPNSPAIDAGIGSCSAHDQRWQPRPVDGNSDGVALCDLGAFELQTTD